MELRTFKPFDPNEYAANRINWLGRNLDRNHVVTARHPNTPDGERQWEIFCKRCQRYFSASDTLLEDYRTKFCTCR